MYKNPKKLKLFISYSHEDKEYIEKFQKHLSTLKSNELVETWYDRKILPGKDWQKEIDNNLEDADIICLFISANFLSSDNCQKEKKDALELRKRKTTQIILIIISPCTWPDDDDISKLVALPTDGKAVSIFSNQDEAWVDVCNGLKRVIEMEKKIRQLKIREEFEKFLRDVEILSEAHSQKETIFIEDIFVPPDLDAYDELREFDRKTNFNELLNNLLDYSKIVIAGEGQSGKTTICKVIYKELWKRKFVPIYISDKEKKLSGKIENRIFQAFGEQYEGIDISEIESERIILIIDDFHLVKQKEKRIKDLSKYPYSILIVDDIFALNIKDEKLISSFNYFKINEFKSSLRYKLIKKWKSLPINGEKEIELYKDIDKTTELIDSTLGKIFGKGIMPAYPFFILSTIVAYETFAMSYNQEITSQGYCYQALVYFYLRKQGVKNEELDIYINFLTELAYYLYKKNKIELSVNEFDSFMQYYTEKYTLPIKRKTILKNLKQIIIVDSFNNYSFHYPYIYYFFVAKYLAEHIEKPEVWKGIEIMMQNLHVDKNAYITVFLVYHTKHIKVLDEIELNALNLFDKHKPATLTKDEVKFFDKQMEFIVNASLPLGDVTPEKEREKVLKIKDQIEQDEKEKEQTELEDVLEKDLRRAIKTAEVMGCILKNRIGSLEKDKLEELFEEAMNIHLRILSYFLETVKDKEAQRVIIDYISERLEKVVKKRREKPNNKEMKKIARNLFWNLNFLFVYSLINKIIHSLGSDKLIEILENVYAKLETPSSFLVKHGILMWYLKNLQTDEIAKKLKQKDFSKMAERVMKFIIVNHCCLHPIKYKDKQKIESKLGISKKMLPKKSQKL